MISKGLLVALGAETLLIGAMLTLAFDMRAHEQVEMIDGINRWGYRGAVARQRRHDETRLLVAGGTAAFQPGVALPDTVTARVRFMIEQWVTFDRGPVTATNIAQRDLPRGGYAQRLRDFSYLAPDVICLYVDLAKPGTTQPAGLLTQLTGYVPILPMLSGIDRRLGQWRTPAMPVTDDVDGIRDAALLSASLAPTVIAIPEPASIDEMRERDAIMHVLAPIAGDARVKIIQLHDGPAVVTAGVLQPAIAVQIEAAVSAFLRARPAA